MWSELIHQEKFHKPILLVTREFIERVPSATLNVYDDLTDIEHSFIYLGCKEKK